MKCSVVVILFLGALMGGSWADEYIDMCPCLPISMCRGVFRANPEDEMYFSRVLQCTDEMHTRCCNFSVTIGTEAPKKPSSTTEAATETPFVTESTQESETATEEIDTEDSRFDREDFTTETPTSTIENRENTDGVLIIYPTEVSGNATAEQLLRTFDADALENELILVFPQESARETRATMSDDDPSSNTTPQVPKQIKKYRYSNATRKRFMPILKINDTQSDIAHSGDVKPIFKVTNSDNRRFLEELYRNRTRFGVPASQITTSATPVERSEDTPDAVKKSTQRPMVPPKRNLFYDPTKRKSFLKKNAKDTDGAAVNLVQNYSTKQAVDINHREMIQEVLTELKKESNNLAVSKDIVMDPKIVAKIGNIQKRLIERIVDTIATKMEGRDDFEEITATTKREQTRPFRGSLRYVDTLKDSRGMELQEHLVKEPKRPRKPEKVPQKEEFDGSEGSLPINFRPSPLWTLQRGEDAFPVPQVSPAPLEPRRESRDVVSAVVPEGVWPYRGHGFVPIPQIPRTTTPIQIIGPIPKGFTHSSKTTPAPSELPSEQAPLHFRRFTGKVFSRK